MKKPNSFNPLNQIQVSTPGTNQFNKSFDNKLSLNMGPIYPVFWEKTLPGASYSINPEMLIRYAPMTFPVMQRMDADLHFFYVPTRIIWNNFEKFISGKKVADVTLIEPFLQGTTEDPFPITEGSIFDYFGLPLTDNMLEPVSALPIMAYFQILNQYYQDQNNDSTYEAITQMVENLQAHPSGLVPPSLFSVDTYDQLPLPNRAWMHDYFTSALPFAQKGEAVNIPLQLVQLIGTTEVNEVKRIGDDAPVAGDVTSSTVGPDTFTTVGADLVKITGLTTIDGAGAELAGTINQLRAAEALQQFLEIQARSGTRYNEFILSIFGVNVGDARINRPEFLGSISNNVVISEVLQTSATDTTALGDYAGYGSAVVRGNTINAYTPEHGLIMAFLSVKPTTGYMQGIPRKFSCLNQLDYPFPQFAHIGEQAVLNKEIFYSSTDSLNNDTFGYMPKDAWWKFNLSEAHGSFRTTMKDWHLIRDFATRPSLTEEFIYVDPAGQKRIFAVTDPEEDSLYAHIYFNIIARLPIPYYSNPGLIV